MARRDDTRAGEPAAATPRADAPRRVSRRAALRAGAAALAAGVLARPALAGAATDEGGLLLGLWRREMGASLAYDRVAHLEPLFVTLRGHEFDHAAAIATELAAVGLGTPRPPQWVSEIDASAELLARADAETAKTRALVLEEELVALYQNALPNLSDSKIAMTAATILASHSQHALILRRQTDGG
ncbi:ferritin-like domain-containing protein [Solirubrobacter soli]|uniref:ferritin-like domain-containing protein n=1 Tax=Solirubrobacter soli TaxID=363832 RepID=UPI0004138CFD|nr:ferritin-like domain-containing protein [Solirubrobacter soli]